MTMEINENNAVKRQGALLPQSWVFWAAIGVGISYMIPVLLDAGGSIAVTAWKGLGVALLAVWAARNALDRNGWLIAAVMAFGALGDVVLESDLVVGGIAFAIGHVLAIYLYLRNGRETLTASQKLLAIAVVLGAPFIAWAMPYDRAGAWQAALYTLFVAAMASAAWISRFPRYRTGLGAMMFVVSDLFIFSRFGPLEDSFLPTVFVWPLYFGGQALIAWGVVDMLTGEAGKKEKY